MGDLEKTEARVVVEQTEASKALSGPEKELVASIVADTAERGRISASIAREVEDSDPHIRAALIESFASLGITTEYLARKLKEGMEAEEVRYAATNGKFTDEKRDPDHKTRHQFVKTALQALGADKPQVTKESHKIIYRSRLHGEVRDVEVSK